MSPLPTISVIIPTYNRKGLLRETLDSLAQQTYPRDRFEVIIVDDGSTDGTAEITTVAFPFALRYFRQINRGDAAARNIGVQQSSSDFVVFLDDDIVVERGYLTHLINAHEMFENRIIAGSCKLWLAEMTPFSRSLSASLDSDQTQARTELQFQDVFSNNMSLRREAYFKIGMMEGLEFPGSSMWCDLDFNYRASRKGYDFFRSPKAVCWHRDYAARSLEVYKKRVRIASYRAVILFQKYPELAAHVPMFYDKTPIIWRQDPARLIVRKLVRSLLSTSPALWSMEQIVRLLEKYYPASALLTPLYRYIVGGYTFEGYRDGLHELERKRAAA